MRQRVVGTLAALVALLGSAVAVPPHLAAAGAAGTQSIVLAGGCFWGVQAVFQHVKGVVTATAGYSGGWLEHPEYEQVSTGETGHAESVSVVFDPAEVSLDQLLEIFFSVAHDPTQLNRQGFDLGTQYRSAVFYANDEQKRAVQAWVAKLTEAKTFADRIVTEIDPLKAFYPAEEYHQNYVAKHPRDSYVEGNDLPLLDDLRDRYPALYRVPSM